MITNSYTGVIGEDVSTLQSFDQCQVNALCSAGKTLGNANMSDEVLNNLLQRSEVFKEILAMDLSMNNNDRAAVMSAHYNLLTYLGNAR